jgi:hypothetical protein
MNSGGLIGGLIAGGALLLLFVILLLFIAFILKKRHQQQPPYAQGQFDIQLDNEPTVLQPTSYELGSPFHHTPTFSFTSHLLPQATTINKDVENSSEGSPTTTSASNMPTTSLPSHNTLAPNAGVERST